MVKTIEDTSVLTKENASELLESIKQIEITVPTPEVKVEPPKVSVTVPKINIPPAPEVNMPTEMGIKKPGWLTSLFNLKPIIISLQAIEKIIKGFNWPTSAGDPIAVRLSDGFEFYKARGGGGGYSFSGGGTHTQEMVPTILNHGKKTVTAAGTRVQLDNVTTLSVTIKALSTNTGIIYVGNSGVTSSNGFQLLANESVSLAVDNLNKIYLDSSVNGEGITYILVNQ